ncbi:MAG TPA: N-formylglutamate amidohydrolase [Sphingomicrobium sp.]|nr:N-formylglutamate amidohydrolase [Sphingomicrobium sp.]
MRSSSEAPVLVRAPASPKAVPAVYDSPHSGRNYPPDFIPVVPIETLRGYEDRLVEDLIRDAPDHGIAVIAANFARAYIDPNRAIDDLDPQVVGDDWSDPMNPTPYSKQGLGLVFRTGLEGKPIYERPLGGKSVSRRIETCWRPYHEALEAALFEAQERWGAVWHIAWHSMRPVGDEQTSDPGEQRPDFVVSDRDGTSAEPHFTAFVVARLEALGYEVAVNHPFKGGYITSRHGRPDEGRHSIQVEMNRALYLDLETLELSCGAEVLRNDLDRFSGDFAGFAMQRAALKGS